MKVAAISRLRIVEIKSKYKRFIGNNQTSYKNRDFLFQRDLQRLSSVQISNKRDGYPDLPCKNHAGGFR